MLQPSRQGPERAGGNLVVSDGDASGCGTDPETMGLRLDNASLDDMDWDIVAGRGRHANRIDDDFLRLVVPYAVNDVESDPWRTWLAPRAEFGFRDANRHAHDVAGILE